MNATLSKYLSRHYHLTVFVLLSGATALFTGRMSGGEYVALCGGALASFRIGDVFDTWLHGRDNARQQPGVTP